MRDFLSDRLKATRDAFKHHTHGGKVFFAEEIVALVEHFDELVTLAKSQENELSRHQWNEAARREAMIEGAGNVISFPGSRTNVPRRPSGGGNAA
jgi:hypothetical protein